MLLLLMFFSAAVCSCSSIDENDDLNHHYSDKVVKNEDLNSEMNSQHFLKINKEIIMLDHILTQF